MQRARNTMLIAAAVTTVSAFLPWASFLGYSKAGIDGDGVITLIAALIGLALLWRRWGGWILQGILAAIVFLVALYDLNDAGNLAAIGLYLTFLAGAAWLVGVFMALKAGSGTEPVPPATAAALPIPGDPPGSTLEP